MKAVSPSILFIAALSLGLSGCSIFPESRPITHYVLGESSCAAAAVRQAGPKILLLKTSANAFLDSQRISYSERSGTRDAYKLSAWVEPPTTRFNSLLLQSLECSGAFDSVTQRSISTPADFSLSTEILEMMHDVSQAPTQIKMLVRAELVDMNSREIVASNTFSYTGETAEESAAAAIERFNQGTSTILAALVAWTIEHASASE